MARAWLAWWTVSAGLWLALVDRTAAQELAAGAAVAAVAAAGAIAVRRDRGLRPPRPTMRTALSVVTGVGALVTALARPGRGRIVELPLEHGSEATAEALGSVGANAIVLGVDRERRVLRVHQLVPDESP